MLVQSVRNQGCIAMHLSVPDLTSELRDLALSVSDLPLQLIELVRGLLSEVSLLEVLLHQGALELSKHLVLLLELDISLPQLHVEVADLVSMAPSLLLQLLLLLDHGSQFELSIPEAVFEFIDLKVGHMHLLLALLSDSLGAIHGGARAHHIDARHSLWLIEVKAAKMAL